MVDIFYKSYSKDFHWLYYSLRSVKKYLTGYNQVIVIIPEHEQHLFDFSKAPEGVKIKIIFETEYGNGYLFQQWVKMKAHTYSKADFILFADSDCIFNRTTDIDLLIKDGKPEILYTHYDFVGDAVCWKAPTSNFMNETQEFEFMRRLPLIYHRSTLEKISKLVPNLEAIIMHSERFSEFNAIGAWAFRNEPEKYYFVNTNSWKPALPISRQFWSHSGLDANDLHEINLILN